MVDLLARIALESAELEELLRGMAVLFTAPEDIPASGRTEVFVAGAAQVREPWWLRLAVSLAYVSVSVLVLYVAIRLATGFPLDRLGQP